MAVTAIIVEHLLTPKRFLDCQILSGKILIWQIKTEVIELLSLFKLQICIALYNSHTASTGD